MKRKGEKAARNNGDQGVRNLLEAQRKDLLSLFQRDLKAGLGTPEAGGEDIVDRANLAYDRELVLALSNGERHQLQEIDDALSRLDQGDYGSCIACGSEVAKARLSAVPWARFCVACQEMEEKGLLR